MNITQIVRPYLVGIYHVLLTIVFLFVTLALTFFSGLAFLIDIGEVQIVFLSVVIGITTVAASVCLRSQIRKGGDILKTTLAASLIPLFVTVKSALIQHYAYHDLFLTLQQVLPVLIYIIVLSASIQRLVRR